MIGITEGNIDLVMRGGTGNLDDCVEGAGGHNVVDAEVMSVSGVDKAPAVCLDDSEISHIAYTSRAKVSCKEPNWSMSPSIGVATFIGVTFDPPPMMRIWPFMTGRRHGRLSARRPQN
jgi:hypothetical protein